jgi:hypothetical protein
MDDTAFMEQCLIRTMIASYFFVGNIRKAAQTGGCMSSLSRMSQ